MRVSSAPSAAAANEEGAGQAADEPASDVASSHEASNQDQGSIRIVADEANDALLISCNPAQFERIRKILATIDIAPRQVMLEATVAEVVLRDELKFGLKWFFESGSSAGAYSNAANGAVSAVFPGFNYLFSGSNARVALEALSTITDVSRFSSPSIMVLDNKTAMLQVGDQVPVAIQQAIGVTASEAPVVNTIELKDTGIILSVTPRVNENGRVNLRIEQEVSDVVPTTTSALIPRRLTASDQDRGVGCRWRDAGACWAHSG